MVNEVNDIASIVPDALYMSLLCILDSYSGNWLSYLEVHMVNV